MFCRIVSIIWGYQFLILWKLKKCEKDSSYVENGKNDAGPIKQNAVAINKLPIKAEILGCINLSTMQPQMGAVIA